MKTLIARRVAAFVLAESVNARAIDGILSTADQTAFDAAMDDVEKIDGEIADEQTRLDAEASAAAKASRNGERLTAANRTGSPRTMLRNEDSSGVAVATGARSTGQKLRSENDPTRGFRDIGQLAMAIARASVPGQAHVSDLLLPLAAGQGNNVAVGSEGGFLVPPQFSNAIWDGFNEDGNSLMGMCDKYPVEGDSLTLLANAETSRANGSRFGGVQAFWLAEAAQITKTKPTFRNLKLEPHGLAALVFVTEKMLRSPTTLTAYLQKAATEEINFVVGDSIINGTGAGQPLGVMKSGALVTVAKEAGQATLTLSQANISKMWARLHPRCRKNAVWFYNVDVEPQLDGLNTPIRNQANTDNVGGIGNNVYNAEKQTLKGRPIMPSEFCASLTNLGDIILADMSMYAIGQQGGVDSAVSMHLRFDFAEQAFRFMFYMDGQPWLGSALTPFKGTNTLSSMVTLQAR